MRRYFLYMFVLLTCSYFVFGTYRNWGYKIEGDGKYYYQYLVSGIGDGDLDFTNNYRQPAPPWMAQELDHYHLRDRISPATDRPANLFAPGTALLWLPFYLVATGAGAVLGALGVIADTSPWGLFFQYTVMFSAVCYTVIALWLLVGLIAPMTNERSACIAAWLVLVGTNLFYYTVFEVSMSHVYDLFTYVFYLALFVRCCDRPRPRAVIALALAGALHVLVRPQNLLPIAVFSILLGWYVPRPRLVALYAATLGAGLLPYLLLNFYLYGNPFVIPQGGAFLDLAHPHLWGVLFSERNGLFSQHPLLLLGAVGFGLLVAAQLRRKAPTAPILLAMLVAFGLQVYVNASTLDWWAGDSFGQRRLVSSLPLFAYGLAFLADHAQRRYPRLLLCFLGLCTVGGLYLTYIHVFLWVYDDPHNIWAWMFLYAPRALSR